MGWLRGFGVLAGLALGGVVACTDRGSTERSVAREFAAHLCPIVDACPCEYRPEDCEGRVLEHFGRWERRAIELGLQLDTECLDAALETVDEFADCGREWFSDCRVYGDGRGVGEPCESLDPIGLMSPCAEGLGCRDGSCAEPGPRNLALGDACTEERGVCGDGLKCDNSDTMVCVETKPTGAVCTRELDCSPNDFCRGASPEVTVSEQDPGVCSPRTKEPGESCEFVAECRDAPCFEGKCIEETTPLLCDMMWTLNSPDEAQ